MSRSESAEIKAKLEKLGLREDVIASILSYVPAFLQAHRRQARGVSPDKSRKYLDDIDGTLSELIRSLRNKRSRDSVIWAIDITESQTSRDVNQLFADLASAEQLSVELARTAKRLRDANKALRARINRRGGNQPSSALEGLVMILALNFKQHGLSTDKRPGKIFSKTLEAIFGDVRGLQSAAKKGIGRAISVKKKSTLGSGKGE